MQTYLTNCDHSDQRACTVLHAGESINESHEDSVGIISSDIQSNSLDVCASQSVHNIVSGNRLISIKAIVVTIINIVLAL